MKKLTIKILFLLLFLFPGIAFSASNFVKVNLPHSATVELPQNWFILDGNQRKTLDAYNESVGRISNIKFTACLANRDEIIAKLDVTHLLKGGITQRQAKKLTQDYVRQFDKGARKELTKQIPTINASILEWKGTTERIINKGTAYELVILVTECKIGPIENVGNLCFYLISVFNGPDSFGIYLSYLEDFRVLLQPICDRIISSIRINPFDLNL